MDKYTVAQAKQRILNIHQWPAGECDYLGGWTWTGGPSGYNSAHDHAEWLRARGLLHPWPADTSTVPDMADVLFEGGSHGYGHRATWVNGRLYSTDMLNGQYHEGAVSYATIAEIQAWGWGQHVVGWAEPWYFGQKIAELGKQAGNVAPVTTIANQQYALPGMDSAVYQGKNPPMPNDWFDVAKCSEGMHTLDPQYHNTCSWVRGQGKILGHYPFLDAGEDVGAQIAWFIKNADVRPHEFVALDFEAAGLTDKDENTALSLLEAHFHPLGIKVMLYTFVEMWLHVITSGNFGDGLWLANPSGLRIQTHVTITQAGEQHGADADYANFPSVQAFQAWIDELLPKHVAPPAIKPGTGDLNAALAHVIQASHLIPSSNTRAHQFLNASATDIRHALATNK